MEGGGAAGTLPVHDFGTSLTPPGSAARRRLWSRRRAPGRLDVSPGLGKKQEEAGAS